MNYKNVVAPYFDNIAIEESVEAFRKDFWGHQIPVEIEDIIELKLNIDIVPVPSLKKLNDIDALITSDWKCIYVDRDEYLDDRRYNRLRFSLAHEIGHFVMHKKIYSNFDIKNREDYNKFYRDIPELQYRYLEGHVNKFASYLLIPRKILAIEVKKEFKNKYKPQFLKIDRRMLNSYLAKPLSKIFKVSEEAVTIALDDIATLY